LLDKECIPPEQFIFKIKRLIQGCATAIYQEIKDNSEC